MRLHGLRHLVDDRPAASCQPACFKLLRTDLMQLVSTDLMQVVSTSRSKSAVGMAALIYGFSRDPRVFDRAMEKKYNAQQYYNSIRVYLLFGKIVLIYR